MSKERRGSPTSRPGETTAHQHRTFHLQGPEADLDTIARAVLGVNLAEIASALTK